MSLPPEDKRGHGGQSRSRFRDNRDRSGAGGAVRFESPPKSTTKSTKKSKSARFADEQEDVVPDDIATISMPSIPGVFDEEDDPPRTQTRRTSSKSKPTESGHGESSSSGESEREPAEHRGSRKATTDDGRTYSNDVRSTISARGSERRAGSRLSDDLAYGDPSRGKTASPPAPYPDTFSMMPQYPDDDSTLYQMPSLPSYAQPEPYRYADPPDNLTYRPKPDPKTGYRQTSEPRSPPMPTRNIPASNGSPILERRPPSDRKGRKSNRSDRLSVEHAHYDKREPSPARGLGLRTGKLSVNTSAQDTDDYQSSVPPPSPLLETYVGTYQSMSPMPSPEMLPESEDVTEVPSIKLSERKPPRHQSDSDSDSDHETQHANNKGPKVELKGGKKRVKLYDAEGDADQLAEALNHRDARPEPLIDILPDLTHDQLLALRNEYKKRVKIQGRGVNISKQIKATTTGNFSKVCYATSLGRWESEAYWANFWYQAHSANRELLIEALMGRCNADIREIKDGFSDKRYQDDLSLCMEKELKPDKFRTAVLLALEGDRQEDTEVLPVEYRKKDAETLHRALKSHHGSESAILEIVILRSDSHLRMVLKMYEREYKENFAREALRKSTNLVVGQAFFLSIH